MNTKTSKKDRRKGYESLLLLLLTIALFVTATYAWFTDSAFTKGNKLFTGNLFIEIVASEEDLLNAGYNQGDLESKFGEPYKRQLTDGTSQDYYYVSNKDAHVVNLYNMEPGQFRKASVKYLNTGDLAFKTVGALKLDTDSNGGIYNGFEVLNKQFIDSTDFGFYKNKYQVTTEATEGNVELVTKIRNVKNYLFSDGLTESQLCVDDNNIVSIDGVDCFVLQFVEYDETKDSFKVTDNLSATHALMMTKETIYDHNISFGIMAGNYDYSNSNLKTVINALYSSKFNNNPSFSSAKINYYYSPEENKDTTYISDVPQFSETGFKTFTLEDQSLFAPDASLFNDNINKFNGTNGARFFLNASSYDGSTGNALYIIEDTESGGSLSKQNVGSASAIGVRPCFYYDLTEIPEATTTIDPKTIYENNNDDNSGNNFYEISYDGLDYDEYKHRFDKMYSRLEKYILHDDLSEDDNYKEVVELVPIRETNPVEYEGVTKGYLPKDFGDMSNILEVYVTSDEKEVLLGHKSNYYFGNLNEFSYLLANGPSADETLSKATEIDDDSDSPDNYYKILKADATANLYADYQRYLACGSGYCLPIDTVTNPTTKQVDPNTKVKVYSKSVHVDEYELVNATEMGKLEFMLYMPTDAGNEYQNSAISLCLGGTASQVTYEVDDLGIMIYDGVDPDDIVYTDLKVGDYISLNGDDSDQYFKVIDVTESDVTCLTTATSMTPYAQSGISAVVFSEGYVGIPYANSLYKDSVNAFEANLQNNNPSLYNSLKTTEFSQLLYELTEPSTIRLKSGSNFAESMYFSINEGSKPLLFRANMKGSQPSISSKVRPLTLNDLYNYCYKNFEHGTSNSPITSEDINSFVEGILPNDMPASIWLADASYFLEEEPDGANQNMLYIITNYDEKEEEDNEGDGDYTEFSISASKYSKSAVYGYVLEFDTEEFENYVTVSDVEPSIEPAKEVYNVVLSFDSSNDLFYENFIQKLRLEVDGYNKGSSNSKIQIVDLTSPLNQSLADRVNEVFYKIKDYSDKDNYLVIFSSYDLLQDSERNKLSTCVSSGCGVAIVDPNTIPNQYKETGFYNLYLKNDASKSATLIAESVKALGGTGSINYLCLTKDDEISANLTVTIDKVLGIIGGKKLDCAKVSDTTSANVAVQAVIDAGSEFNNIIAFDPAFAQGAIDALKDTEISYGKDGDVVITTFGNNIDILKYFKNNEIKAYTAADANNMANECLLFIKDIIDGNKLSSNSKLVNPIINPVLK